MPQEDHFLATPARRRAIAAFALALAAPWAAACGVCVEDRVAAVYDSRIIEGALAKRHHMAFFGLEGPLPATADSRRAVLRALQASGGITGSARISLPSASCSVAYDPRRTSLASLREATERRLAARGLSVAALRVIDDGGRLVEPARAVP